MNARSIFKKLAELHLFIENNSLDLLCVTETWLNENIPDSLICPTGYKVFRYDRPSHDGGVAIFVRSTVTAHQVSVSTEFKHIEIICIDVNLYGLDYQFTESLVFIAHLAYIYLRDSVKCFQHLCSADRLVGDFNLPCVD